MRTTLGAPILILGLALGSCVSARIDDIAVYGRLHSLSAADIRAAIAVDRAVSKRPENRIYAIDVVSSTKLRVYHTPRWGAVEDFDELFPVKGKWYVQERVLAASD